MASGGFFPAKTTIPGGDPYELPNRVASGGFFPAKTTIPGKQVPVLMVFVLLGHFGFLVAKHSVLRRRNAKFWILRRRDER